MRVNELEITHIEILIKIQLIENDFATSSGMNLEYISGIEILTKDSQQNLFLFTISSMH